MKINKQNVEITFTFKPSTHILVKSQDDRFGNNGGHPMMVWSLNGRIDRSYKGKDDDIGIAEIYLTDEQAEQLKKEGFSFTEL